MTSHEHTLCASTANPKLFPLMHSVTSNLTSATMHLELSLWGYVETMSEDREVNPDNPGLNVLLTPWLF